MLIFAEYTNLIAGGLFLLIAILVTVELRRQHVASWLGMLLIGIFSLEFVARLDDPDPLLGHVVRIDIVTDLLVIAMLIPLAIGARYMGRTIAGARLAAQASEREAKLRAAEYERARRDYVQLARHRLANPLTIVRAAAQTLEGGAVHDPAMREQLARAIVEASYTLERISLDPEPRSVEEHSLDAVPRVEVVTDQGSSSTTAPGTTRLSLVEDMGTTLRNGRGVRGPS